MHRCLHEDEPASRRAAECASGVRRPAGISSKPYPLETAGPWRFQPSSGTGAGAALGSAAQNATLARRVTMQGPNSSRPLMRRPGRCLGRERTSPCPKSGPTLPCRITRLIHVVRSLRPSGMTEAGRISLPLGGSSAIDVGHLSPLQRRQSNNLRFIQGRRVSTWVCQMALRACVEDRCHDNRERVRPTLAPGERMKHTIRYSPIISSSPSTGLCS